MSKKNKAKKRPSPPKSARSGGDRAEPVTAGLAWYTPESYARLLELSADRAERDATYEAWLESAENGLVQLQMLGVPVVKVLVDVEALARWCGMRGQRVDRHACSAYVTYLLSRGKAQIVS